MGLTLERHYLMSYPFHDIDIDECSTGGNNCDANAECTNTPGSFTCTCNQGYSGDGVNCIGELPMYYNLRKT